MKKKNKEISIFNLSMLDVIMSAMGAFLIIVVLLLPYYKKDVRILMEELQTKSQMMESMQQEVERTRQKDIEQQKELQEKFVENQELLKENSKLREQHQNTFMILVINWKTEKHDIDLHVIDPAGNEFFYSNQEIPGVDGKLSEDTTKGPGVEVWEISKASAGDYKIYYNFYSKNGNGASALVSGRVYFKDGNEIIEDTTLVREKEKILVATISVQENGDTLLN